MYPELVRLIAFVGAMLFGLVIAENAIGHKIGEPDLEKTQTFQDCCHEMECRHWPMVLKGRGFRQDSRGNRTAVIKVYVKDFGNVWIPASTLKKEKVSHPVLCTWHKEYPDFTWSQSGVFIGNVKCVFFPKRRNEV